MRSTLKSECMPQRDVTESHLIIPNWRYVNPQKSDSLGEDLDGGASEAGAQCQGLTM